MPINLRPVQRLDTFVRTEATRFPKFVRIFRQAFMQFVRTASKNRPKITENNAS